jgi:hypothetical protein
MKRWEMIEKRTILWVDPFYFYVYSHFTGGQKPSAITECVHGEPSEESHEYTEPGHDLPVALVNIDSDLGNEGVRERKLCHSIPRNGELADADDTDAELRHGDDAAGKLTDCNHALGWHGHAVRVVFEGNVQ